MRSLLLCVAFALATEQADRPAPSADQVAARQLQLNGVRGRQLHRQRRQDRLRLVRQQVNLDSA